LRAYIVRRFLIASRKLEVEGLRVDMAVVVVVDVVVEKWCDGWTCIDTCTCGMLGICLETERGREVLIRFSKGEVVAPPRLRNKDAMSCQVRATTIEAKNSQSGTCILSFLPYSSRETPFPKI
jgi:hypothetical protein